MFLLSFPYIYTTHKKLGTTHKNWYNFQKLAKMWVTILLYSNIKLVCWLLVNVRTGVLFAPDSWVGHVGSAIQIVDLWKK